ncbi:hypothetical protein AvCA_05440 [Azotobacter vinelandii CA]|uniref:Uncharacterized protein n=2 Tax=Azotobacter vinelandii TaxID=354 RepID=C1DKD4_AZOVD|nr:hypothetical protein Avin_05440 [Azotobacter vinelandii DJ]AGK17252.1 hypothetical protein AvCA_05440 [Azotobacter vinelandii CA]AGK19378.1 hypothetical protein AvCA6_05440 [Azotobacter vinelandii CA6]
MWPIPPYVFVARHPVALQGKDKKSAVILPEKPPIQ